MKLYQTLESELKKESEFVADNGEIKKWVIISKAQNYDAKLIGLLLDNEELKHKFFIEVKSVLVFNQALFVQFMEQKNYLNDSYTAFRNKVGLTIDGRYLKQRNEVALVWPFKDCVLEGGQSREEDKREEIFFNEILAQDEITQLLEPKVLTNAQKYSTEIPDGGKVVQFSRNAEINKKRGLPKNTITDNLIIKGNNLLALHSLKEEFAGKVKLIYIDPPFNTDNDGFKYNDSFTHSTWLTFMKNRLNVAKELLSDEGVIFVHCDDNEQAYLKILMDEIFDNRFVNTIAVRSSTPSGIKTVHKTKTIIKQKDYLLVYKKSDNISIKPQYTKRNNWDKHYTIYLEKDVNEKYIIRDLKQVLIENKIINENQNIADLDISDKKFRDFYIEYSDCICQSAAHKNKTIDKISREEFPNEVYVHIENSIIKGFYYNGRQLQPLTNGINEIIENKKIKKDLSILLCDFWSDIDFQNTQNEGGNVSFPAGKKPELLIYRIINMILSQHDIILDFHLGSGTTAAVAHKLGIQYIGIEQLNYGENDSVQRLRNVINGEDGGISKAVKWSGGGSFVYLELKKHNQQFIDKIEQAKDTIALFGIWEEMKAKSYLNYNVDIKKQDAHIEEFKGLSLMNQKRHLVAILDKNQLYVNRSAMNDADLGVTDEEIEITNDFYQLNK